MQNISHTQIMQDRIRSLRYGKEYAYNIFSGEIRPAVIRKNIERFNGKLIGKSANGLFYKRLHKKGHAVYEVPDSEEEILFDPEMYSFNAFWSSGHTSSRQSVKAIIRNYLSAMDAADIIILIKQFGIGRVRSELIQMFKEDYQRGFVDIKGMHVPLSGRWDRNQAYLKISKMLS